MGGHGAVKKTKYFSIDEIPDSMVATSSKRDPDNQLYKTRRWVNFKKKQILFAQQDGIPNYLRTRGGRFAYYSLWTSTITLFVYNIYKYNQLSSK